MRLTQVTCVLLLLVPAHSLRAEKQYQDQEEYRLHSAITASLNANDLSKAMAGLEEWKQKYPGSAFAANRQMLVVQAYVRGGKPAEAVVAAKPVIAGPFDSPDDKLRLLFAVSTAVQQLPAPDAEQRAIATEAANELLRFDTMPAGVKTEEWEKGRAQLQRTAAGALIHVGLTPIRGDVEAHRCSEAEGAATQLVRQYPYSVQAAWVLGAAQICLAKKAPEKYSSALYSLARAAVLDPVQGLVDPTWQKGTVEPYLDKVYSQYHGADSDGLRDLKEASKSAPLPPTGFQILSAAQVEQRKQADFESKNPELALWLKIRYALTNPNEPAYFESVLKNAAVPPLVGTLVTAKPACRPTELTVAMDKQSGEVLLKLSRQLAGKAEAGSTVRFEGVPVAFQREPFLLTMAAEAGKITGTQLTPCGAANRKRK